MDAKLYDELWNVEQSHWWFQARRHIVWSLVCRYMGVSGMDTARSGHEISCIMPTQSRGHATRRLQICELGCGTGGNLAAVADRHDVVGVECSPHALEYARRRLGHRVRRGSLPHNIDLPPESFDVVLLTDVLEHIEDDTRSARTALQLLRPGGIVVATVPAYQWLYSPRDAHHHHFRRYSKRRFRELWIDRGAEILLLSHYNTILFPAAAAARLASKWLPTCKQPGDLAIPPTPLNGFLARIMRSESNLLGRLPLPFGLSLVAVVRNRGIAQCRRAA
jgi:2-polyprenyl-3-methyl-5-hydroxy-6-metoxy-1,4-benzoquinol methylase